jgi:hypothetical protein
MNTDKKQTLTRIPRILANCRPVAARGLMINAQRWSAALRFLSHPRPSASIRVHPWLNIL